MTVGLVVTGAQRRRAIASKAIAAVVMRPIDFLKLTTPSSDLSFLRRNLNNISDYNRWSVEDLTLIAPFIGLEIINPSSIGKVTEHEGRHRALASMNAGFDGFPVFIIPCGYGRSVTRVDLEEPMKTVEGYTVYDRPVTLSDLPSELIGQYNENVRVRLEGAYSLR